MATSIEILKKLYQETSKHSNYQILPNSLRNILRQDELLVKSRNEQERLDYILSKFDPKNKTIIDIGGNTGFFSLEFLDRGAKKIDYYEGNKHHADFIKQAAELLNYKDKIDINNQYLSFSHGELQGKCYDLTLLLNVLHHIGDDYGDENLSKEKAKEKIIDGINFFADKTHYLILQIGFCWKGNRNSLLFENGTKKEMIDFIENGVKEHWEIEEIMIPVEENGKIKYKLLDTENIKRNDKIGEFLNRPIFLLKSSIPQPF